MMFMPVSCQIVYPDFAAFAGSSGPKQNRRREKFASPVFLVSSFGDCYPFRPVVAMPSVNCFWATKYMIRIGTSEITAPAISKFSWGPASVWKAYNP